jgi:DNA-binding NtrC family response regulator/TolB-like protein
MESLDDLIGDDSKLSAIRGQITRLLRRQAGAQRLPPVLVLGETGTGKTLLARSLHRASPRASGPFVSVNCAAIPETLLESELFGFERGAFTDAHRAKAGLFQSADGGTLFLDEIGATPLGLQTKLLTAIEDRMVRRLGSIRAEQVDLWILAATSEDLTAAIRERRFRQDLYHRLSAIVLTMPPLRARGRDIVTLAEHFLGAACRDYGLPGKRLSSEAAQSLVAYPWPGNVRELANLMERVAVLSDETEVTARQLGLPTEPAPADPHGEMKAAPARNAGHSLRASLDVVERAELIAALESSHGNLSHTARRLGIARNTLRYRLVKHGLGGDACPKKSTVALDRVRAVESPARVEAVDRPIAFVLAILELPSGSLVDSAPIDAIDILRDKVHAFGGRAEEISPTHVVASFGLDDTDDFSANAVHAAQAIRKALAGRESDETPLRLKTLIHVAACRVVQDPTGSTLDPGARERALAALRELALGADADSLLVAPAAVPALQQRFALAPAAGEQGLARIVTRPPIVAGRPSIAVLPFRNLTGDSEQEYFGDGITEDIIGALSRFRWLFVIARHSTLTYKSKTPELPQIVRDLGVRYVVAGTVRRLSSTLRVTADLVDAEAGDTLWAERYDGDRADIFAFQDRIVASVVATLDARVRRRETERALQKRPDNLDAYECVLRALHLFYRFSRDDFLHAAQLLDRAIVLDGGYAAAYAWRAWWHSLWIAQGWCERRDADTAAAERLVEAALVRDPDDPFALAVSGHVTAFLRSDPERAVPLFEQSLERNPNAPFTWGLSAPVYCYLNQPNVALDRIAYALRLSPFDPMAPTFRGVQAFAEMLTGRYEAAVALAEQARREASGFSATLRVLTASLAELDRLEEARQVGREFLAIERSFTLKQFRLRYPLRDEMALDRYIAALRRAGLPE